MGLFRKPGCLARIKTLRVRVSMFVCFLSLSSTIFSGAIVPSSGLSHFTDLSLTLLHLQ